MSPLAVGDRAPGVPGVAFGDGPIGLFFYKVTCPTCQLVAPRMAAFDAAFPGRVTGVGQDPPDALVRFADDFGIGIGSVEDAPPYPLSVAYDIVSVPTLYLIDEDGRVADVVGSWDREGFNRVASALATATGGSDVLVSSPDDGLPAFQPG